jgi:predicted esterase
LELETTDGEFAEEAGFSVEDAERDLAGLARGCDERDERRGGLHDLDIDLERVQRDGDDGLAVRQVAGAKTAAEDGDLVAAGAGAAERGERRRAWCRNFGERSEIGCCADVEREYRGFGFVRDIRIRDERRETRGVAADDAQRYDWFCPVTNEQTDRKTYEALERSLEVLAEAIEGIERVGVLGFSQGCALAVILASLASRGDPRFGAVRFGLLLSGFKPVFDEPDVVKYPIEGGFPRLLLVGDADPLFRGGQAVLTALDEAFEGDAAQTAVVPGLSHDLPTDPAVVQRLIEFATDAADKT